MRRAELRDRLGPNRRQSSTPHYQTFPTTPPTSRGKPPLSSSSDTLPYDNDDQYDDDEEESPLPTRQLVVLAIIALAEQTALNSIAPYLPQMVESFPSTDPSRIGLYTGAIASSFAFAQFLTGYFWGWLSDRIGRKPVILLGTMLTAIFFLMFGFCSHLWQAVVVQALMGLMNGNQGVVSTCLGEITDRTNQSRAFVWLPVVYGIGGITGPALGGLLVLDHVPFSDRPNPYPYLLPNIFAAGVLAVDFVAAAFFLEESLEGAQVLPPLKTRVRSLFVWVWQFAAGAVRPTYTRRGRHTVTQHADGSVEYDDDSDTSSIVSERSSLLSLPDVLAHNAAELTAKNVLNRNTLLLLGTYLVFQLSNISFNTLYPIFAYASPPLGRAITSRDIGLSLSLAGLATIIFQVFIFGSLKEKLGNKITYRIGLGMFTLTMFLTPFVSRRDDPPLFGMWSGAAWMWIELGFVLLVKTVASVAGLTAVLLLITNSSPSDGALGALNGVAQTLSAAGRAIGPIIAGGLFSAATDVRPKGELIPFGTFAGVAALGFVASFWIQGDKLESEEYLNQRDEETSSEEEYDR